MINRAAFATARSGAIGLLAGLAGSLCCLGPSAAVLLGLGSSSALAGLAFDRALALAIGGALLAAGLWLARRHTRACEVQRHARWRQPALMLLSFVLAYGLLGYALPRVAARQADIATAGVVPTLAAPQAGPIRRATLIIEKMSCPPCAASVRGAFTRKPYVRRFTAETNNEQVTLEYDSRQASVRDIIAIFPRTYGITLLGDEALPEQAGPSN